MITTNSNQVSDHTHTPIATPTTIVDNIELPPSLEVSQQRSKPHPIPALQGTYRGKVGACRVPGQRPMRKHGVQKLPTQLRQYQVPDHLRDCTEDGTASDVMAVEPTLEEVGVV